MNCEASLRQIYECLDRALTPDEQAALDDHLADCPTCRKEQTLLARDRRLLASVKDPQISLDVARLFRSEAATWNRSRRRWRSAAMVACAASLLLACWLGVGMRVEVSAHGTSIFWGDPVRTVEANQEIKNRSTDVPPPEQNDISQLLARHQQRLDELNELIGLVAAEIDNSRARERRLILAVLERELDAERRANESRMQRIGRSFHALHLAQLSSEEQTKGE